MNIFQSFILGIIQGLTEFIPVSSTAHLLITQKLLGVPADNAAFAFNVLVQLGTLLALILYYGRDLWALIKAFFAKPFSSPLNKLAWHIIIATIPALVFGKVGTDSLEEVWTGNSILRGLRSWLPGRLDGVCSRCLMKYRCLPR